MKIRFTLDNIIQVTSFFHGKTLASAKQAFEQAKERMKINIQFLSFNFNDLKTYLLGKVSDL